jgi:hypothetical protein
MRLLRRYLFMCDSMFIFNGLTREWPVSPISTEGPHWKFRVGDLVRVRGWDQDIEWRVLSRVESLAWPHYMVLGFGAIENRVSQLDLVRASSNVYFE